MLALVLTPVHPSCMCGCGRPVPLAKKTSTRDGTVKGQPTRFLRGHGPRPPKVVKLLATTCSCGAPLVSAMPYRKYCDTCRDQRRRDRDKDRQKERRTSVEYKAKYRAYTLQRNYGLTQEQYNAMLAAQGGCCAICRQPSTGSRKDWHVDHDHVTEKVRGILCSKCNNMIGLAAENPTILQSAIDYILRGKENADAPVV